MDCLNLDKIKKRDWHWEKTRLIYYSDSTFGYLGNDRESYDFTQIATIMKANVKLLCLIHVKKEHILVIKRFPCHLFDDLTILILFVEIS